jgi:LacI family transcriptional regulator
LIGGVFNTVVLVKGMSITLRDIAKMAGVSTATVSRVINNKIQGNMRRETKDRVRRIIEKTGYTPHALASGLRKGMTSVIGVVLPDNVNPYYAQLGKAIESESFQNGYLTLLCNSNYDVSRERDYIRHLTGQRVSGILLCSTGLTGSEIASFIPPNIHVVLLDEELSNFDGEVVVGDDFRGGYEGARYLHELGHERVLVIRGSDGLSSSRNRLRGYFRFLEEHGEKQDQQMLLQGDYTLESSYNAVSNSIRRDVDFTAVFAFNDMMAVGAIEALRRNGIDVPGDVSVLGYDNIFIDELFKPSITTIATPFEELGRLSVMKLLNLGDEHLPKGKVLLEPKLIVRDSCSRCRC